MPETRYIETYEQGTGKLISRKPYEVSDEELVEEQKSQRMANILDELDALKVKIEKPEKK